MVEHDREPKDMFNILIPINHENRLTRSTEAGLIKLLEDKVDMDNIHSALAV